MAITISFGSLSAQIKDEPALLPNGAPAYPDEIAGWKAEQGADTDRQTSDGRDALPNLHSQGNVNPFRAMACPSSGSLTTFYGSNNGQAGQMFDIQAVTDVVIECFDVNMYNGGPFNWELRYKTGTHVGFESNAAAWNLLGTAAGVPSNGSDNASDLPIAVGVSITAGQRAAFYMTVNRTATPGGGNRYTNGTGVGNLLASDATIRIYEGTGKAWLFSTNFTPRQFNGTVYYNPQVLDAGMQLTGEWNSGNVLLKWNVEEGVEASGYSIERSVSGQQFNEIAWLSAAEAVTQGYTFQDPTGQKDAVYQYRIIRYDQNGSASSSNVVSVNLRGDQHSVLLAAYPIPAHDQLTVSMEMVRTSELKADLVDVLGKTVHSEQFSMEPGIRTFSLSTANIAPGIYSLVIREGGNSYSRKVVIQ